MHQRKGTVQPEILNGKAERKEYERHYPSAGFFEQKSGEGTLTEKKKEKGYSNRRSRRSAKRKRFVQIKAGQQGHRIKAVALLARLYLHDVLTV